MTWQIETEIRPAKLGERYIIRCPSPNGEPVIGIAGHDHNIPTYVITRIEEVK